MLISVVIPLYNKKPHVSRAVKSVLDQSFSDYEIVIVDDGSTDGSIDIVRSFTDTRIRILQRDHVDSWGGHAARNLGIKSSEGKYIAFLDADDEWMPNHLSKIIELINKYPECGVYATSYEYYSIDGFRRKPKFNNIPEAPWEGIVPSYFKSCLKTPPVWTSAAVIPRKVFDHVGLFPENIKRGGDLEMWGRIALKYSVAFSNEVTAVYHTNASNRICLTETHKGENILDRTLKTALIKGDYSDAAKVRDIKALLNRRKLNFFKDYIVHGEKKEARMCLKKTALTWYTAFPLLLYYLVSLFPYKAFLLFRNKRESVIRYLSKSRNVVTINEDN